MGFFGLFGGSKKKKEAPKAAAPAPVAAAPAPAEELPGFVDADAQMGQRQPGDVQGRRPHCPRL